jgi:hypothetical protein
MFQASDQIIPREFEVSLPRLPISHPKIENPQLVPPDVVLALNLLSPHSQPPRIN